MKKIIITILKSVFVIISISACTPQSSPAIYFINTSNNYIKNVKGNWNGYYLSKSTEVPPSASHAQVFNVESKSHIFGPVHLEWENAQGKKFTKDFIFKKEELPSYLKSDWEIARMEKEFQKKLRNNYAEMPMDPTYFYIKFYFTQEGVEYFTSDDPNIEAIRKEKHQLSEESFKEFRKKYPVD